MSSKKLVCFLVISIIYGLIAVGGAHASIIGIEGIVSDGEGTPLAGVKVTAPNFGSIPVNAVTDATGAYFLPYISFANVVIEAGDEITVVATDTEGNVVEKTHIVTAADVTAGRATFNITFVSTTVTVAVAPTIFNADTPGTGTVTVTVARDEPITDETVTLSLSPAVGTVSSPATNNGDGTYSATYTSGGAAGNVRLIAMATGAKVSGSATITINAGSPAAITLTAVPDTVSSLGRSIVTATVSDNRGNGVGGVSLTGTASSGTLTNFASAAIFGTYTATYTAPMVDAEGTDTVTVTVDDISAALTVNLTPVPPREVTVLIVEGTVFKVDGEIPADGVTVTVTVGANPPQMGTTDKDGNYSATFFNLATVARTGDPVSIIVTDATGAKRGETNLILNNDQLGEDGTGTVDDGDVTTDIVIPPRSVSVLAVEGVIYSDDGSPLEDVDITVTVEVGTNPPTTAILGEDGVYSATTVNLLGTVAITGDMVSTVVVTDADGAERGRNSLELSNKQLGETGSATVTLDVMTDITLPPKSVNILVVEGVVYRDDKTSPAGPGLDVAVTVGSNPVQTTQTESDGSFSTTFLSLLDSVASSGDAVLIVVSDGSGERGRDSFTLNNALLGDTDSATVTRKVFTNIGATSGVLAVTGTVYFKNGTQSVPAASHLREGDLTVVVTNTTRNLKASGPVDDDGGYDVNFLNLLGIVAETGDMLTLEVQNEAGDVVGSMTHALNTSEVTASNAKVDIHTTVPAQIRALNVIGSVIQLDGSLAGAGVGVTITIAMNGQSIDAQTVTDVAGGYEHTFVDLLTPVASTGDILIVDVVRASDQFRNHKRIPLQSYELVDGQITVPPIMLIPPRLELGGLSINPHYTGIQDPAIQQVLNMDLASLATNVGNAIGGPEGELLTSLLPSDLLLISPILAVIGAYQLELPAGFDPADENIAKESFGNAITTRPTAWAAFSAAERDSGRWVNGDQLNLYISGAPTIDSVTFTLNGTPMSAAPVSAGDSFMYNFQLEEELVALFSGNMPAFGGVQLMIDGQAPIDMMGSDGVWSVQAPLTPGSDVSYYYMVELSKPYHDLGMGLTLTEFPLIDPRNRQLKTEGLSQVMEALLQSELTTLDPGVRSVFSVPAVDDQQSLWVGTLPLAADGMYQLDVNVTYLGGHQENITGKTFTVDRTPPTAEVALNPSAPGHNAGMYPHPTEAGVYIATGPMPGEASLTVSISSATSNEPDGAGYLFQLAKLDAAGNPGAWNPVVAADLLPLNLETLLTDPGSVLPLTGGGPVDMLIRTSAGDALLGRYGIRAVGIDSLLNMDSGRGPGVMVDLVPPDPNIAKVSYVTADFDGNGVIEGLEMQSAAGDVVVFSDSLVTLTVDVTARAHPFASIAIEVEMPGLGSQPVAVFSGDQLAAAMVGDQLTAVLPVPDIPGLPDRGNRAILRTTTTNALNVVNTQEVSVTYERRTAPEVSAVHTYVTDRHPDSGAAQGTITVSAFTQVVTAPDTTAVQLEARRSADTDWMPLGVVQLADTKVTSHIQIAIIEDLINSIIGGSPTAPISLLYREWPLSVDSTTLEDTIGYEDVNGALDPNPWVVRAIAVDAAGTGYPAADGVEDRFSLDNYSPTVINQVANEVGTVAPREDGSYYVSGLIAEDVDDPMLTLTSRTGSHSSTFPGGLKLAVNNAAGEAMEIAETAFSASGNYIYTGAFNLASIPNGTYTFMVVAHAADGTPETRIDAMRFQITVEVGNFTPPENFADPTVDILSVTNTRGDVHSPSEIDAQYATGLPAIEDEVCVTLIVPNVAAGDVDVIIGDAGMSAAAMGALTVMDPDANNNISVCLDTSGLDEGMYSLVGRVNKPNGFAPFGLPSIQVDRSAPVIAIVSPLEGHQVSSLPTIQISYSDATGFDPEKRPRVVTITLTRLGSHKEVTINPEMIRMVTAAGEVLTQSGSIVYSHDEALAGGAYRVDASLTDALGNTATAEPVEFTSSGIAAGVSIITPAPGQVVDPDQPLTISAALSGNGEITVSEFSLNGTAATPTVANNMLTHTVDPDGVFNRGAGNTVTVKIVDEEGNTAEATSTFTLALDTTPPVVATYSPLGIIRTDRPIAAATVTDESGIKRDSLRIIIAGVPGNQGTGRRSSATSTTVTFTPSISVTPGPYTARVTVEDVHGNRTEVEWQFTVELDVTPPAITTSSPHGVIRSDKPIVSVSASDDMSGVDTIDISVKNESSQAVAGVTSVRSDKTSATFTPTEELTSGTYTVDVKLADMSGNKASGQWQFTVELDTIAPSVLDTRPTQEHTENRRPLITATYTDNMSGVDAGSVKLTLDASLVEPDALSDTQVAFTPKADLPFGPHTVRLEVSDMAGNTAAQEWTFYVERIGIANARNYPNPFEDETTIAFRLSRQSSITIRIYDFTGRLVAQPIANARYEAGEVKIDWHNETAAGDHLARGVYFCHILMEDNNFESQSAILKMAIISE